MVVGKKKKCFMYKIFFKVMSSRKWSLPGANLNLRQKFKKNKIQKNFEFCLSFEFASGSLHFPLLITLKSIFYIKHLFYKIFS